MQCVDRYEEYKNEDFDRIILLIRNGTIKCGKYAHLVKIDKKAKVKTEGELFRNGSKDTD